MWRGATAASVGATTAPESAKAAAVTAGVRRRVRAWEGMRRDTRAEYAQLSLMEQGSHEPHWFRPVSDNGVKERPLGHSWISDIGVWARRYSCPVTLRLYDTATRAVRDFVPLRA